MNKTSKTVITAVEIAYNIYTYRGDTLGVTLTTPEELENFLKSVKFLKQDFNMLSIQYPDLQELQEWNDMIEKSSLSTLLKEAKKSDIDIVKQQYSEETKRWE